MTAEAVKLSDTMPGLASFTRTAQACMPLLVTAVLLDTAVSVPLTGSTKLPTNTVAFWPT